MGLRTVAVSKNQNICEETELLILGIYFFVILVHLFPARGNLSRSTRPVRTDQTLIYDVVITNLIVYNFVIVCTCQGQQEEQAINIANRRVS